MLQSSSRQARGSERSTLEERLNFDPLSEASPPEEATGLKRSYMALVLSPVLDFSLSYELLHFAFDLGLWTDLGAKRNLNLGLFGFFSKATASPRNTGATCTARWWTSLGRRATRPSLRHTARWNGRGPTTVTFWTPCARVGEAGQAK